MFSFAILALSTTLSSDKLPSCESCRDETEEGSTGILVVKEFQRPRQTNFWMIVSASIRVHSYRQLSSRFSDLFADC